MKQIYILNTCDAWKSSKSMSLVAATTSLYKLKNIIVRKIRDEDIEYRRGHDDYTTEEQVKLLKADWDNRGHDFVFDNLDYGYVKTVADGEIQ